MSHHIPQNEMKFSTDSHGLHVAYCTAVEIVTCNSLNAKSIPPPNFLSPPFPGPRTTFMSDMREVLGAPEWFLAADLQTTSFSADQQCVTFVIHFMGKSS